jgi:hypothetical protein
MVELNLRLEAAMTNGDRSPIGSRHFDSAPSSSLSQQSPYSFWEYQPSGGTDRFQGNFGMRQLSLGFRPHQDVQVTLGPNRYEVTDAENLCMEHAFSPQCKFAFLSVPLGYFGGEVAYDRERKDEAFKRLKLGVAAMHVGYGGIFVMGQGMFSHRLGGDKDSPLGTLHGYAGVHDNPSEDKGKIYMPGVTIGEGAVAQLEYGIFTGLLGYSHRFGKNVNEMGFLENATRDGYTLGLTFKPGAFQFHSMLSYLTRLDTTDDPTKPPKDPTEWQSELNVGWRLVDGMLLALGYRGIYGEENAHMGFLGIRTDLRHTFPFGTQ